MSETTLASVATGRDSARYIGADRIATAATISEFSPEA